MSTLAEKLDEARAEVARLERQAASATCHELGRHQWVSIGGCNAGCGPYCGCSVPVLQCEICGDCDYGDNSEADETKRRCKELSDLDARAVPSDPVSTSNEKED